MPGDYLNIGDNALDDFMTRNLAYIAAKTLGTPAEWTIKCL